MRYCRLSIACEIIAFVSGLLCVIIGAVILGIFAKLYHKAVEEGVSLVAGSEAYESFLNPKYSVLLDVWFFNLTNAERYFNGVDKKPQLKQLGPYRYSETLHKTAHTYPNGTIEYRSRTLYVYLPKDSVSDKDLVTIPNVPLLTLYHSFRNAEDDSDLVQSVISQIADLTANRKAFVTKSVRELMFEGYDDPLLQMASLVGKGPKKMGFFYDRNDTDSDSYLIDKHGKVLQFQGNDKLTCWDSAEANMLNGSDGTIFMPFVDRSQDQYAFSADICRSIRLQFKQESSVSGISTYKYLVDPTTYHTSLSENSGFCLPSDHYYSQMGSNTIGGKSRICLPEGMLNISSCKNGAPMVLSQPHFSGTPVEVQTSVSGLTPNELFDTVIEVEPTTGLGLHFEKRSQVNVAVYPFEGFNLFGFPLPSLTAKVKPAIIPVFWLNETATADGETVDMIRRKVLNLRGSVQGGMIALIVFGVLLMVASIAAYLYFRFKQQSKFGSKPKTKADGTIGQTQSPTAYDNAAFNLDNLNTQTR